LTTTHVFSKIPENGYTSRLYQ